MATTTAKKVMADAGAEKAGNNGESPGDGRALPAFPSPAQPPALSINGIRAPLITLYEKLGTVTIISPLRKSSTLLPIMSTQQQGARATISTRFLGVG